MLHETRYVAYDTPMETVARDGDYITIRIAQPIPDEVL